MTPEQRNFAIVDAYGLPHAGFPAHYSTSVDACFTLAANQNLPLNIYRDKEGDVFAGVYTDTHWGKMPVAEAACMALLEFKGIEQVVKVT